jgi:hypothetical protein
MQDAKGYRLGHPDWAHVRLHRCAERFLAVQQVNGMHALGVYIGFVCVVVGVFCARAILTARTFAGVGIAVLVMLFCIIMLITVLNP